MSTTVRALVAAAVFASAAALSAQGDARALLRKGHDLWSQRLSKSAIAAFEAAARDRAAAAEAHEALGRIYLFKGWRQEGVFPGWHDEPEYRKRAIAELKAAVAADPSRESAREALRTADAFAAADKVDPEPARVEVTALDARIDAWAKTPDAAIADFDALVSARTALQADPAPYFAAAQIMLERRDLARANDLATRGVAAAERFIAENESAYKMAGKSQGALARSRAAALDVLGSAAMQRLDFDASAAHFEEAERLSRGQDFLVQFHLGELMRARKSLERARHHYLNALTLRGGPSPMRDRAMQALADIHAALEEPAGFDAWLEEALETRQRERREAALRSLVDRRLPALTLTTLDGRPYDLGARRGKVLLLNFFSSW